jgi:hypothetical protein
MRYSVLAATCLYTTVASEESSRSLVQRGTTIIDTTNQDLDDAFIVPKNFVGFGIESAFADSFNNTFSKTLVRSLGSRMSQPPIIRIGGTSGDYFTYDPEQTEPTVCVGPEDECNDHQGVFSIGPRYFDVYENFEDAQIIVQAPLGNPISTSNTLDFVWSAWNRLGQGDKVAAIALGNEVEFIYESGAQAYVDNALLLQDSIVANLSLSGEAANIFEAGNSASGSMTTPKLYQG